MNHPARPPRSRRPGVTCRLLVVALLSSSPASCGGDPPPNLSTSSPESEESPAPAQAGAEPRAGAERELWFTSGHGYEAIVARERGDHVRAREELDALLAEPGLRAEDRAAAELLRALESVGSDAGDAATRLARAREQAILAPLVGWMRVVEAQAWLDAGEPGKALELVRGLEPAPGIPGEVLLVRADALARTDADAEAQRAYLAYLEHNAQGPRRGEARIKLARVLARSRDAGKRAEAAALFEKLILDAPLSDYAVEAKRAIEGMEKDGVIHHGREEQRRREIARGLSRAEALLDQRRYADAIKSVDNFLAAKKSLGLGEGERCQALFIQGNAIFKQRKRADARPIFAAATKACHRARNSDLEVKSRYQAARGRYAAGEYARAAADFEGLARDHADHSYADDALVKAGESWEVAGEPLRARTVLERSLAAHADGDMAGEARRRLLLQALVDRRHADALALTDGGIADPRVAGDDLAKLHYFRGRALAELARADEARAAYLEAVRGRPLSYAGLQALSRLRELGEAALAEGLAAVDDAPRGALPGLDLPPGDAQERIRLLARLGLGEQAKDELEAAGIRGWPAVAVLDQSGLWNEAQKTLANTASDWRSDGPAGDARRLWQLAHPRPYRDIIDVGEREQQVPAQLTYAIMQTESRFDAGAVSWAGARGLIQLMPATAEGLAKKTGIRLVGPDALHDPNTNLSLGMWHLARLSERFGGSDASVALAIPSYNAGAGSVDTWIGERGDWDLDLFIEAIPFDETRAYTQSVLGRWLAYRWLYGEGAAAKRIPYLPLATPGRP